jgi:hypothetical protein
LIRKGIVHFSAERDLAMRYPHLGQYAQRWDALVGVRPGVVDFREIPMKPESVKSGILESLRTIRCTENVALPRKFPLMLGAMKCIELISRRPEFGPELMCAMLKQLPGRTWFMRFLIFNAAVVIISDFLSVQEKQGWIRFESCVLTVLHQSAEMLDMFAVEKSRLGKDEQINEGRARPQMRVTEDCVIGGNKSPMDCQGNVFGMTAEIPKGILRAPGFLHLQLEQQLSYPWHHGASSQRIPSDLVLQPDTLGHHL